VLVAIEPSGKPGPDANGTGPAGERAPRERP
jgi:hypothetical protein